MMLHKNKKIVLVLLSLALLAAALLAVSFRASSVSFSSGVTLVPGTSGLAYRVLLFQRGDLL